MSTVLDGFFTVVNGGMADRFPGLRWGFFEAGAGWVPWLLQNSVRSDPYALRDERQLDWRSEAAALMADRRTYVAAYVDDDLAYLASLLGNDHLVIGSDWGHYDAGSDLECHRTISKRGDIDEETKRRIVDTNARNFFGIGADFCPTGKLESVVV
jgi:uncharacterized protein